MDERVEAILRENLGDAGFDLVSRMMDEMENSSGSNMKDRIRKMVEVAADEEGVQAGKHRTVQRVQLQG